MVYAEFLAFCSFSDAQKIAVGLHAIIHAPEGSSLFKLAFDLSETTLGQVVVPRHLEIM